MQCHAASLLIESQPDVEAYSHIGNNHRQPQPLAGRVGVRAASTGRALHLAHVTHVSIGLAVCSRIVGLVAGLRFRVQQHSCDRCGISVLAHFVSCLFVCTSGPKPVAM